jgi:hypothetical protein
LTSATKKLLVKTSSRRVLEVEFDSLDIHVVIPTKAWSKCMMKCKGKEMVEEGDSFTKVI